jgi:hypothetical protein
MNILLFATESVTSVVLPVRVVNIATKIAVTRTAIFVARNARKLLIYTNIFAPRFAKTVAKNEEVICPTVMTIIVMSLVIKVVKSEP